MPIQKIDNLGRIVVPKEIRNEMGWKQGTEVSLELVPGGVTIRHMQPFCCGCGSSDMLIPLMEGKHLCADCYSKATVNR